MNSPTHARRVVLVTGGSGLVGSALQSLITKYSHMNSTWNLCNTQFLFVNSTDADLRDSEQANRLFRTHLPTHVVHLAARVGGLYANIKNPVSMFVDNHSINDNILFCCNQYHVKRLFICLSTCIFPDSPASVPLTEDMLHQGSPHLSNEPYAYSKRMMEVLARAYQRQYGFPSLTFLIPTNLYGPCDNFSLQNGHVLPSLIHRFIRAKKTHASDIVLPGSGRAIRQFLFSCDFASIILQLLSDDRVEGSFICADEAHKEVSIRDLADIISHIVDYSGSIHFDISLSDGQLRKTCSNQRLRELLPSFEFTSLYDGIKESVMWFEKNYALARK